MDLRSVTAIAPEEGSAWTGAWTGTHETPNAACVVAVLVAVKARGRVDLPRSFICVEDFELLLWSAW